MGMVSAFNVRSRRFWATLMVAIESAMKEKSVLMVAPKLPVLAAANAAAAAEDSKVVDVRMLPNDAMGALFEATVGATEEAIVNALVAGRTMKGFRGNTVVGLPHDKVRAILERHVRLAK